MKHTLAASIIMAAISTSAYAENFNNTSGKVTLESDKYFLSLVAPKTGASEFAVGGEVGPVDATVTYKRDGDLDDYQIKIGKSMAVLTTPIYIGTNNSFDWGDSTTKNTLTLEPHVGVSRTFNKLTPYAETGYSWQSKQGSFTDMDRNAAYIEVGANYTVSEKMSVGVSVTDTRDKSWDNGDKEAQVGITVKF
jgi:predicted porin